MKAPRVWQPWWLLANLSANETNDACVFPSRPRPASRSNRPDTYQRLPQPTHDLYCETQPVHTFGSFSTGSRGIACHSMSALPQKQPICAINSCAMSRLGSRFFWRGGFPGCVEQTPLRHACAVRIWTPALGPLRVG